MWSLTYDLHGWRVSQVGMQLRRTQDAKVLTGSHSIYGLCNDVVQDGIEWVGEEGAMLAF